MQEYAIAEIPCPSCGQVVRPGVTTVELSSGDTVQELHCPACDELIWED